jgi:HEAT repeat protein
MLTKCAMQRQVLSASIISKIKTLLLLSFGITRREAAQSLGKLKIKDDRVVDALVDALLKDKYYVRSKAAESLGKLGICQEKVLNALLKTLKIGPDAMERMQSAR